MDTLASLLILAAGFALLVWEAWKPPRHGSKLKPLLMTRDE